MKKYKINDIVWTFVDGDVMERGRVVLIFQMPDCPTIFYVIKLDGDDFMHLEVRDAYQLSDAEDKMPPMFWQPDRESHEHSDDKET